MRNLMFLCLCGAGLGGCAERLDAPLSPTFGQAVASMQAQVIPAVVVDLPPTTDGVRAVSAITRYQKGEVKKPETASTSALGVSTGNPSK